MSMMLIVLGLVALALYLAQRHVATEARHALESDFHRELEALHQLADFRNAALNERCRGLVSKPRIHAALEDNALDLLYPSAKDELRDLMQPESSTDESGRVLRARFYRFLDNTGTVLPAPDPKDVGELAPQVEAALGLKKVPARQENGYIARADSSETRIDEILATPIFSSETGEVISALVVGFKPLELPHAVAERSLTNGIWLNEKIYMPGLASSAQTVIGRRMSAAISKNNRQEGNFLVNIEGQSSLLFYKWINPDSSYPPAYEVSVYPLAYYETWERKLRWQVLTGGMLMLAAAFGVSQFIARRLAEPVEQLAEVSERTEAELESTTEELERTARYSADASHQLKSPVTVLRAGIESLLNRTDFAPEIYEELSALLHQTYRLTGVIDDLLLLARMDAGRLRLAKGRVNLTQLINGWLEDLSALPEALDLKVTKQVPANLNVLGERRYTSLIVQNLLENARKYNRPGGRIDIRTREQHGMVSLTVGNTGRVIDPSAREYLFERFQRGVNNESVAGHGLGLNLARELARLHGGDLRLIRSENDWTEFEVRFRVAERQSTPAI